MSTLNSVLEQYEKNKKNATSGNGNKVSIEDRKKMYFSTVLPKGEITAEKRIRILPTKDGSSPFVEVKFHEILVDGKWLKLYDPGQENKRSPLNETAEGLKMDGEKELAKAYYPKKFYIVKIIDRDAEQDGPKWWRFKHNSKGDGALDKIIPIWRNKGDITDANEGRDLILTCTLTKSGNGKEYTTISSVIPEDKDVLHSDPVIAEKWINDPTTWTDAYSKKPEEYLEMIAKGEVPKWDSEGKKWYSSSTEEADVVPNKSQKSTPVVEDPQEEDGPSDDLPF
jgi:hypothetical protein